MLSIGLSAFLHYSWNCNYRTTSNHLLTLSLSNVQYYRKLIFLTDEQKQNFSFFDPIFQLLQLCNSSADWAKDLFKASTDSSWDWNYFFFFGFSVSDVTMRACFRNFLTNFTRPWAPTQWAIFWLKLYLETTLCSTSSELLNDFLAYLEPKLWAKTKIGKNLCTHKPQAQVDYTHILYGHNSPVDWARELFKPFIDGVKSL